MAGKCDLIRARQKAYLVTNNQLIDEMHASFFL